MKKILSLIIFISGFVMGQNRFIYDYKFIPDSTNRAEIKSEMMYLDIDSKGSKFYSYDVFVSDSIMKAEISKQTLGNNSNVNIRRNAREGKVSYKVLKEYPEFKVFLIQNITMDVYKIAEEEKPVWKIHPDKDQLGTYKVQKATTSFGGRDWTAWFCEDLPFMDGPYKFYGLPGLIVKIQDATESHTMVLVGNKKFQNYPEEQEDIKAPMPIGFPGMKEIEVTENQFKKVWKNYVNDPAKNMREMMMKNSGDQKISFKIRTNDGKEITDPNEIFRNMENRVKENLKKNNNRIEPELYQ